MPYTPGLNLPEMNCPEQLAGTLLCQLFQGSQSVQNNSDNWIFAQPSTIRQLLSAQLLVNVEVPTQESIFRHISYGLNRHMCNLEAAKEVNMLSAVLVLLEQIANEGWGEQAQQPASPKSRNGPKPQTKLAQKATSVVAQVNGPLLANTFQILTIWII
jgi:hypothetical protein